MSPASDIPKPKPKNNFGKPEKRSLAATITLWSFFAIALALFVWAILANPREKQLVCNSGGQTSLIGFGSCTEQ